MSALLFSSASSTRAGRPCHRVVRSGFTLIELLVVIGIIVILIAILLPAAAAVRKRSYATSTSQEISTIAGACQQYYQDYHSYPGPVAENDIDGIGGTAGTPTAISGNALMDPTPAAVTKVTSSENLVLGLTGGLNLTFSTTSPNPVTAFNYSPSIITQAQGPQSLNILINSQKQTFAYFSPKPEELPPVDTTAAANYLPFGTLDSKIPEYLDHIPGNVLNSTNANYNYGPILYFRARVGTTGIVTLTTPATVSGCAQYNFPQAAPYGFTQTTSPVASVTAYFTNPALSTQPIGRDAFILISAGSDRIFGTSDDIIYGN